MAIILIVTRVNGEKLEIEMKGKIYIGRLPGSNVVFSDDERMSGRHGKIQLNVAGELLYSDLGSSNGSFVNNIKISETVIKSSDVLRLGATCFRIDEKRLTVDERNKLDGNTMSFDVAEDKTSVITNADLFLRPKFEKTIVEKRPSLAERWNLGDEFLSDEDDDEVPSKSSNLQLDKKKK